MNRPYQQLKLQEILSLCKQSIRENETLWELKREISFRKDSSKRNAYELIDIAIRLNADLSKKNASLRQFDPEKLTLDEAYEVLGVHPDASFDEIFSEFTELLRKFNPDKANDYAEKYRLLAEKKRLVATSAYDLILQQRTTN